MRCSLAVLVRNKILLIFSKPCCASRVSNKFKIFETDQSHSACFGVADNSSDSSSVFHIPDPES